MVAVVHRQPVFCSPAATPLTVSWTRRSTRARSGSSGGQRAEARKQADLQLRQASRRTGCAARSSAGAPGRRRAAGRVRSPAAAAPPSGGTRPRSPPSAARRPRLGRARRTGGRRPCPPWPGSSRRCRARTPGTASPIEPADLGESLVAVRRRGTPPAPVPRPYQPGRLIRDCDHANVQGIAREGRRSTARRRAPARPRAAGRDPRRRSDSSAIGVMSRKNAANAGSSWTSARYARRDVSASSARIGAATRERGRGGRVVLGRRGDQHGPRQLLEVAPRDGRIRVVGGDDLALLGELEPAVDRPRRLAQDRPIGGPAAPADGAATAVERASARRRARRATATSAAWASWSSHAAGRNPDSLFESE